MSINKAQAKLLADDILGGIGTSKDELQPRETIAEIFLIAGELVEDMQNNLNQSNSNASGSLSKSIVLDEPRQSGSVVRIDILMNQYGRFVNKGVQGLQSGKSTAGYKFKTALPSEDMVKSLEKGINNAKKSTSNTNAKKSTSRNEKKNSANSFAKAFGAGVNIKRYGIKPTGFIDKAIPNTLLKVKERLGAALKIDIIASITQP